MENTHEKKHETSEPKTENAKPNYPPGTKYLIEVENKVGYLKNPDRGTIDMALGLAMPSNGNPQYIRAGEIVLQKCWVGGDDEILKDDDLLVPAAMQAFGIIKAKTAVLKKI